jgi:hypothetical protein
MALQPKDPSAAVITSVGGSATGGSISSTTPVITGTADAGDVVSIYDGVRLLGTAIVAANGTWSFTPTTPLKAGNHSFAAIPTDSQGNHGASSNVVTAAIGSSAPATPGTPTVTDDKGHTIPAGGTTADSTPTFSGTGTAGDTITVYDNGTAIGSTTIAGDGTWSWTPTKPLPSGDNSIVIIETNPAGTPSSGSTPIHVVVDTSVPATPPAPTFTDDSGHAIPAGGTTADATPHIAGKGTAGDTITVYDNGKAIGSTTVAADGTWSFTPTTPLASGDNSITVTDTNAAGTSSAASTPTHVVIDTSTPATPAAPTFTDDSGHTIPAGGTTADATPHINGKGTAGDTITVYDNGKAIGSTTVAADGTWSFTPTTPLASGDNSITVTDTNAAGTSSAASTPTHVVINTSVPATPAAPTFTNDSGTAIPAGSSTTDAHPHINGTGVAGDIIKVYDGSTIIGSTTVAADGKWTFTPATDLSNGGHSINVTDTNSVGTSSAHSASTSITISPLPPVITSVVDSVGPVQGPIPAGGYSDDPKPVFHGTGVPGYTIYLYDNGRGCADTVVAADGTWTATINNYLDSGLNNMTVKQFSGSITSGLSAPWSFTLMTATPATPATPTFTDDSGATIPAGGATTDSTPHIAGTGTAGDTITVYDNGGVLGSVTVAADGTWSFTPAAPLAGGANSITVVDSNAAGAVSAPSSAVSFNITTPVSVPDAPTLTSNSGAAIPDGATTNTLIPHINGRGVAGDIITVYDGTKALGTAKVAADGTWTFLPSANLSQGSHSFNVTETNAAGASGHSDATTVSMVTPVLAVTSITDANNKTVYQGGTASGYFTVHGTATGVADGTFVFLNFGGSSHDAVADVSTGRVLVQVVNGTFTYIVSANSTCSIYNPGPQLMGYSGSVSVYATATQGGTTFASSGSYSINETDLRNVDPAYPIPAAPHAPVLTDDSGNTIASGSTTTNVKAHLSGTGVAGDMILVLDNGTFIGSTAVDASGKWVFNPPALTNLLHAFTVSEVNMAGTSPQSAAASLQVNTTGRPNKPDMPTITDSDGHVIAAGGSLNSPWMTVSGKGVASDTINVYLNGTVVGSATVAANGKWTLVTSAVGAGYANQIDVTETNASGTSQHSNPITVVPTSGAVVQSVHAVATGDTADAQDAAHAAQGHAPDVTAPSSHTVIGEHDAFVGNAANGNETVDLNADPAAYFKESTAHIQGSGGAAIDTLHLTGDHQVLDLSALTGKTSAAKISAIEVFDLGGHSNNLKVSLTDVLNLGETDLFQKDGHQQLMVKGSDGDTVDLSNAHIAGVADGQWQAEGTAVVGGVTYNVYEHSGAHTELLVQQGVQVALHN